MKKYMNKMINIALVCILTGLFFLYTDTFASENDILREQNQNGNSAGITIDGYYDDWIDKPMTIFTWRANNGQANHDVSFIKDENYIYIYVKMHQLYSSPIPIDAIYLGVNGQDCMIFIRYANGQNTTDWGHTVDLSRDGIYTGLHPFTSYPNYSLGDAAITVSEGEPNDRLEMRVEIKALESVMGLKPGTINNGSQLRLRMPNVGEGTALLMGTSTAPWLGIVLCIAVAGAMYLLKSGKSRRIG